MLFGIRKQPKIAYRPRSSEQGGYRKVLLYRRRVHINSKNCFSTISFRFPLIRSPSVVKAYRQWCYINDLSLRLCPFRYIYVLSIDNHWLLQCFHEFLGTWIWFFVIDVLVRTCEVGISIHMYRQTKTFCHKFSKSYEYHDYYASFVRFGVINHTDYSQCLVANRKTALFYRHTTRTYTGRFVWRTIFHK